VELSLEQKQDIVRGICSEDGQVEGSCFDAVKDHIYHTLEHQHYAEFLRSAYYAKHQLEVFSSNGGVTIKGVLNHDVLLFHFMEFMENEGRLGTIHILRKHLYSTKLNLTTLFFTFFFRQNNRIFTLDLDIFRK
jgi:hypothetical protein